MPLADRSVAVLNRGTPGCVVTPDGTLHLSLMRSCSAWPSGIWIDGDRRTAPDGSGFAWQHWSHTFEYALASGPGDWRAAGYSLAAEDYNHDLLTVPGGRARASARAGGLSVEPATVTLGALKPRGNPLAAGRTGALAGGDTVTVRLRETSGRPVTARVRFPGVAAAWLTDLLEESDGAPLRVENDTVFVDLPAFGTVTAVLRAGSRGPAGTRGDRADRACVHTLLAAREGPGAGREPAGRGAPVPGQGGPAYSRGGPGRGDVADADRGLRGRGRRRHGRAGRAR